jgi:vacuolar-type H+-ATPase subunit E/Vma4
MTLESLVEEIRRRGETELGSITTARSAEEAKVDADREARVEAIRGEAARTTAADIARERAQRVAAAKLAARKMLYGAREARLVQALEETREVLSEFTESSDYAATLRKMLRTARSELGESARISGRKEDSAALGKLAGKSFDPTPRPILGGLVAETPDASRRLDLSFDELLRLRGDKLRELLA